MVTEGGLNVAVAEHVEEGNAPKVAHETPRTQVSFEVLINNVVSKSVQPLPSGKGLWNAESRCLTGLDRTMHFVIEYVSSFAFTAAVTTSGLIVYLESSEFPPSPFFGSHRASPQVLL